MAIDVYINLKKLTTIFIMRKVFILLAAVLISAPSYAQNLLGTWNGHLEIGIQKLALVLHLNTDENGDIKCAMDSPDQGVEGIPAEVVYISSDSLSVSVSQIGMTYSGKAEGSMIRGTFTQMGLELPLDLKPGNIIRKRPQEPSEPYPYMTEDVKFTNESAGVTLAGTLTYPVGYDGKKKVPVVIMVTGSGLEDRNEEIYGHKPFLVIADYLARYGIASLRYDDRGFGESTGDGTVATTADFADDAIAGLEYLKDMKKFSKVGLIGHSEGGCIAFMVGARRKADFIISLAGVGVKADVALTAQVNKINELMGMPVPISVDIYRKNIEASGSPWLDWFIDYDPTEDIKATRCPVMAVNGSKDVQVLSEMNLSGIERNLRENKKNIVREYPELNHLFQTCQTGLPQEYANIEESFNEQVLKDISSWINSL